MVELKRIVTGEVTDVAKCTWSKKKVQSLLSELSTKHDHQWTLKQMAERCGIQRTQLNTIFQKLTGSTPMEYLSRTRIERAKNLLRETEIKIIDIAFECGFNSSQYFANTFKYATGMTPSKYRTHCAGLSKADLQKWKNVDFRSNQEELRRIQNFSTD